MEHKDLWAHEDEVPDQAEAEPLGKAALRRRGDAATIVSWSKQVHVCLEAAGTLAERGIEADPSLMNIDKTISMGWNREPLVTSRSKSA